MDRAPSRRVRRTRRHRPLYEGLRRGRTPLPNRRDDMTDSARDYASLFDLSGRQVVVVGAASGIGREAARACAAHGADVVCADRDTDGAADTAELCAGRARAYHLNLLDRSTVQRAATELGVVDGLVFTPAV